MESRRIEMCNFMEVIMASEDITFCMSDCENMKCFRNKKHIKHPEFSHSFAFLENTKDCINNRKDFKNV